MISDASRTHSPSQLGRDAQALLERHGVPESIAEWLGPALLRQDLLPPDPHGDAGDGWLSAIQEAWLRSVSEVLRKYEGAVNAAFLDVLGLFRRWHDGECLLPGRFIMGMDSHETPEHVLLAFAREIVKRGIDLSEGLPHLQHSVHVVRRYALLLLDLGLIDLAAFIDTEQLRSTGGSDGASTVEWSDGAPVDVRGLTFWIWAAGRRALDAFLPRFQHEPAGAIGPLALGIVHAVGEWMWKGNQEDPRHPSAGPPQELAEALEPYCTKLTECVVALGPTSPPPPLLEEAWRAIGWRAYWHRPAELPPDTRKHLIASSVRHLASLRPMLREAREHVEYFASAGQREARDDALMILSFFNSLWGVLKPLLLAMRSLSVPCVASDLRYWNERGFEDDPSPQPFDCFPSAFAALSHWLMGREQKDDAELTELRTSFAAFCLERLKSSKGSRSQNRPGAALTNQDMVDPSPQWRLGYLEAIGELAVNPQGQGHRLLHWSSHNDPDPEVRRVSQRVYSAIRHGVGLQKGTSPRRAVFGAFWQLRKAQLLATCGSFDPDGARRTRMKEMRRTKQLERRPMA